MLVEPHYSTSIASWSFALAKGLEVYGIDSASTFIKAGIDLSIIQSPYSRVPVSCVQKVWRYGYENTDENFGVVVSQFLNPSSFHALGFGIYASSTLKEMIERLIRYRCVISHMFFAELLEDDDFYRLSTIDERKLKTNVTHDTLFCYLVRIARQLISPDFKPVKVSLSRTPLNSFNQLASFFAAPIEFSANGTEMLFTRNQMETPLKSGNKWLAAKQDQLVEQYISELGLISEYMLQVKTEIIRLLALGEVTINRVAENLHITVRTLQRRLADENSSYHDLLDKIRYELALDYMNASQVSATQIAFKLGFNDSGSFTRTFKRWTGQSFSEYRRNKN